jgi:archaellum biogenesis ATPase FlaH
MEISTVVLQNLIQNFEYAKRVIPYIKDEYFEDTAEKTLFAHTADFIAKYNDSPTYEALFVELTKDKSIAEGTYKRIDELVTNLRKPLEREPKLEWLLVETEAFCKKQDLHNAIRKSIQIFDGADKAHDWGTIPDLLTKSLAVSFDQSVGHDYIEDSVKRFEYYHRKEEKLAFDLDYLNRATKGGVGRKTLNMILAGTHAGKTALMCHMAASSLTKGQNVLYITLEMSEEEISKRIDANLFDLTIDDIMEMPKSSYFSKIERIKQKCHGKLKVKEYPTATASTASFRALLNELRLKQGFVPDIIFIDYLNIALSSRIKMSATINSYTFMKAISEEVRGLAIEWDVPIWSASQFNRGSASSSDPSMEGISESFAVNFVADFIIGLIADEELKQQGKVMVKQLKNRYDDMNKIPKFFLGFDRAKMKFYDLDNAEKGIQAPAVDTPFIRGKLDTGKRNFEDFKFE